MLKPMGNLQAFEKPGQPNRPLVVMLHGYGANAYDLVPLSNELPIASDWRWVFPQGPLPIELGGFGAFEGRAWFPIDVGSYEKALREGRGEEWMNRTPQGLSAARKALLGLIYELKIDSRNLILGGFSQGAMLAVDVAIHLENPPKGLLLFSGAPVDRTNWSKRAQALGRQEAQTGPQSISFFQSHGEQDQVLPFASGQALNNLLLSWGFTGTFLPFRGGHEIPRGALREANQFLAALRLNHFR